jgi:hypothetical protein
MIDFPDLPIFDIPAHENKRLPIDEVYKWMDKNFSQMKESGQIERIRQQESRRPVDVKFVFK